MHVFLDPVVGNILAFSGFRTPRRGSSADPHDQLTRIPSPSPRAPLVGRTLEGQGGRAHQDDDSRRACAGHRRGGLQHLPAALRGRLHRPADRQRHQRDERPAVGRHDAGRRGLRRQPQLLPPRSGDPAALRLPLHRPDPPGPRRRTPAVAHPDQARRLRARQHVLHHDAAAPGAGRRHLRRRDRARGPRPDRREPVQGQRRPRRARGADPARGRRPHSVRLHRGHREHGRRPADLDGEHAGGA